MITEKTIKVKYRSEIPLFYTGKVIYETSHHPTEEWYVDGKLHREDGPAVIWAGRKTWYKNGLFHRVGGPAIEYEDGGKAWWFNGCLHRLDGPAIKNKDGHTTWYIRGLKYDSEKDFVKAVHTLYKTIQLKAIFMEDEDFQSYMKEVVNHYPGLNVDSIKNNLKIMNNKTIITNEEEYYKTFKLEDILKDAEVIDILSNKLLMEYLVTQFPKHALVVQLIEKNKVLRSKEINQFKNKLFDHLFEVMFANHKEKDCFKDWEIMDLTLSERVEDITNTFSINLQSQEDVDTNIKDLMQGSNELIQQIKAECIEKINEKKDKITTEVKPMKKISLDEIAKKNKNIVKKWQEVLQTQIEKNQQNISDVMREAAKEVFKTSSLMNTGGLTEKSIDLSNYVKLPELKQETSVNSGIRSGNFDPGGIYSLKNSSEIEKEPVKTIYDIQREQENNLDPMAMHPVLPPSSTVLEIRDWGEIPQGYTGTARITLSNNKTGLYHLIGGRLDRSDGPAIVWSHGHIEYWVKGHKHREGNLPAVVYPNGDKEYYLNGECHRDDGPAIDTFQLKTWLRNGRRHREDNLPAMEYTNGSKEWWVEGERHRENDLPAIEYSNGVKEWYKNGKLHRAHGPAIIKANGDRFFYVDGKKHNCNGFAVVFDGITTKENEHWIHGFQLTASEFNHYVNLKDLPQFTTLLTESPLGVPLGFTGVNFMKPLEEWYVDGKKIEFTSKEQLIKFMQEQFLYAKQFQPKETEVVENKINSNKVTEEEELTTLKEIILKTPIDPIPFKFTGITNYKGTKTFYKEGKQHRGNDRPAVIHSDRTQEWYMNGECHRENGPAKVYFDGTEEYWYKGTYFQSKEEYDRFKMNESHYSFSKKKIASNIKTSAKPFNAETWIKNHRSGQIENAFKQYSENTQKRVTETNQELVDLSSLEDLVKKYGGPGDQIIGFDADLIPQTQPWHEMPVKNQKRMTEIDFTPSKQQKLVDETPSILHEYLQSAFSEPKSFEKDFKVTIPGKWTKENIPSKEEVKAYIEEALKEAFPNAQVNININNIETDNILQNHSVTEESGESFTVKPDVRVSEKDVRHIILPDGTTQPILLKSRSVGHSTSLLGEMNQKLAQEINQEMLKELEELEKTSLSSSLQGNVENYKTVPKGSVKRTSIPQFETEKEVPTDFTGRAEIGNRFIGRYQNGKLHSLEGPAKVFYTRNKDQYWIEGIEHTQEEFKTKARNHILNLSVKEIVNSDLYDFLEEVSGQSVIEIDSLDDLPKKFTGIAINVKEKTKSIYLNGVLHSDIYPAFIDEFDKKWYKNGVLDRWYGPAIETPTYQAWYQNGKLHKQNNLPTILYNNGDKEYWNNGKLHSLIGPAIDRTNLKEYYVDDHLLSKEEWEKHPKVVEWVDHFNKITTIPEGYSSDTFKVLIFSSEMASKEVNEITKNLTGCFVVGTCITTYKDGKNHSFNGQPSYCSGNHKLWHNEGVFHREDGPALQYPNGNNSYYFKGFSLGNKEEFEKHKRIQIKQNTPVNLSDLKPDVKTEKVLENPDQVFSNSKDIESNFDLPVKKDLTKEELIKIFKLENYVDDEDFNDTILTITVESELPKNYTGIAYFPKSNLYMSYFNGMKHSNEGPAGIIPNVQLVYYSNDKLHRLDGPAKKPIVPDTTTIEEFWIEGVQFIRDEFMEHPFRSEEVEFEFEEWIPSNFTGIAKIPTANGVVDYSYDYFHVVNGAYHRHDGPAVRFHDGNVEYWVNGDLISKKLFDMLTDFSYNNIKNLPRPVEITEELLNGLFIIGNIKIDRLTWKFTGIVLETETFTWYIFKDGQIHNENGPAKFDLFFKNDKDRQLKDCAFIGTRYLEGVEYSYSDFHNQINKRIERDKKINISGTTLAGVVAGSVVGGGILSSIAKRNAEEVENLSDKPVEMITTEESLSNEEKNQQPPTILETLMSDAKQAATRVATKRLMDFAQKAIITYMVNEKKSKSTNLSKSQLVKVERTVTEQMGAFFSTDLGKSFLGLALGSSLPLFIKYIPLKYQSPMSALADELRIEALATAGSSVIDFFKNDGMYNLQHILQNTIASEAETVEIGSTRIRVKTTPDIKPSTTPSVPFDLNEHQEELHKIISGQSIVK